MARYIATSGSNFTPYSLEELITPLQRVQTVHDEAADAYDTLNLETEAIRQYISDDPRDSRALNIYNNYHDKLQKLQNGLWENGVNAQTRRDLAAARASFGEMGKVKTAIENRQKRSQEYWNARHNNPDLVTGPDPGLSGLNPYLDNDLYGQNWYSYNGADFMKSVASDAKARSLEMLRNPSFEKNQELKNVITRLRKTGFTNAEVDAATNIASELISKNRQDRMAVIDNLKKNDIGVGILAETLISHLDSTGAYKNVDDSEFKRLVEYGRAGLAQGVGEISEKDFIDPDYAYRQQVALENLRYTHDKDIAEIKAGKKPTKSTQTVNTGTIVTVRSAGYDELAKDTQNESRDYANGRKSVVSNGADKSVSNEYEMTQEIYGTPERDLIQRKYGYDVLSGGKKEKTVRLKNGEMMTLVIGGEITDEEAASLGIDKTNSVAVRTRQGELLEELTRNASNAKKVTVEHVKTFIKENSDIKSGYMTPKKQEELRKKYNLPENAPWSDFRAFVTTVNRVGNYNTVPLATSDSSHGYALSDLNGAMIRQYNSAPKGEDGKTGKDSVYSAYKVNSDNLTYAQEGEDMGDVLGIKMVGNTKSATREIREGTVTNIDALLEDLATHDRPYLRFQTKTKPGETYAADTMAFGALVNNFINQPRRIATDEVGHFFTINGRIPSMPEIVAEAMMPVFDPWRIYSMTEDERVDWADDISNLLGGYESGNYPYIILSDRSVRPARPEEILRDKYYQEQLYDGVESVIANPTLAQVRQVINTLHEQHVGNTNSNAQPENTIEIEQ